MLVIVLTISKYDGSIITNPDTISRGFVYEKNNEELIQDINEIAISEADTIEIQFAGMCGNGDKAIAWFVSGNEYQSHYYLPMEIEIKGNAANYSFVRTYKPIDRGMDIAVLGWEGGYCFLINNPKCVEVEIYDNDGSLHRVPIEKDEYPYLFYWEEIPSEYSFIDKDGNAFNR